MASSTLPPTPHFDPNVPIVSSGGGSTAAYRDPNSPESIMRKTATMNAQALVDSKFDVSEGFRDSSFNQFLIAFVLVIASFFVTYPFVKRKFILGAFTLLLLLLLLQKQYGRV